MKTYPWILFSAGIASIALAVGACGGGGGGNTGGGTGTGGQTTTTSSSHSSSSSGITTSSSSGGGVDCTGIVDNTTACGMCLEASCCQELSDCNNDADCIGCLTGQVTDPAVCNANAGVTAFVACEQGSCDVCIPKSECNPVTNEGCANDGSACDLSSSSVYVCFSPPNDVAICGACSNSNSGPWCKPGLHCTDPDGTTGGFCTAYCCDDGDCGDNGTCDKTNLVENVGICVPTSADGGTTAGVCDSPMPPPSGGSCFTLP